MITEISSLTMSSVGMLMDGVGQLLAKERLHFIGFGFLHRHVQKQIGGVIHD